MAEKDLSTTFLKGLDVLRCYQDGVRGLTLAELSRQTGHDRATVRRLCLTLAHAGLMTQTDRVFRLSPRVLRLAGGFLRAHDFGQSIQPVLNTHAEQLGGEIAVAIRDGDRALYVGQSATVGARVSLGFTVGSTIPLLPTAVGRMILASIPPEERRALIDQLWAEQHTDAALQDKRKLIHQIDRAGEAGVAITMGDYEAGICGIAVPVGPIGRSRAVVGTTLPMNTSGLDERFQDAAGVLQLAAASLHGMSALEHW